MICIGDDVMINDDKNGFYHVQDIDRINGMIEIGKPDVNNMILFTKWVDEKDVILIKKENE